MIFSLQEEGSKKELKQDIQKASYKNRKKEKEGEKGGGGVREVGR